MPVVARVYLRKQRQPCGNKGRNQKVGIEQQIVKQNVARRTPVCVNRSGMDDKEVPGAELVLLAVMKMGNRSFRDDRKFCKFMSVRRNCFVGARITHASYRYGQSLV